ncbi:delta-type opioid receptor-like [Conger conger]|uniref:delta-type opioid receptor-like n=1 Tax=Conger conger TaxID=82655 RepID=UPI002A5AFBF6|nr:delta-type opioid receptor-like [Conger conger]
MEFPEEPSAFRDPRTIRFYNESFFQANYSGFNETIGLLPASIKITIVVVYMVVCVVGLVGNCLVMYVIIRYTKMKTATNIYIFNLALADSLVLATLPFQGADVFLGFWPFGNLLCKVVISIDYYNMFTSTLTLTVMSVDRYIAVCHPVKALDMRTPAKAKVVNVCVWALASAIGAPAMMMGDVEVEPNGIECIVALPDPRSYWDRVFGACVFVFSFVVPVAIISVCYSLMVRRLRSVRMLSGSREKDRNLRRITRMVLVVVAAFVVCWTPVQIMVLAQSLGVNLGSLQTVALMHFCIALGYVNSSLNPVLYAFLDENFKRCFRGFCQPAGFPLETRQSSRLRSVARETPCSCVPPPDCVPPAGRARGKPA